MTKKIVFGLLLLTLVSVALVGSHNISPSVASSANLQAYDNKVRLSFDLSSGDKRNFSSIKRSLGFLSSDSDFILTASPDTVGTINDLNLAKFKLLTSGNK